jgi:hypothetical protein
MIQRFCDHLPTATQEISDGRLQLTSQSSCRRRRRLRLTSSDLTNPPFSVRSCSDLREEIIQNPNP